MISMSSGKELSDDDRDQIMMGIAKEWSYRVIATGMGRHHSVVSNEVRRNGGRAAYRSRNAAARAHRMKARPQPRRLETDKKLHDEVAAGLSADWSPEQVSTRLAAEHPEDAARRVSHETIYRTLFVQARGRCRTELRLALRTGRTCRRPMGRTRPRAARIADMVSISERPAEADDRAVPGHRGSDLIIGADGASQVLTLVERTTRFLILQRIPYDRTAGRVAMKLAEAVRRLPDHLWRSITHDQGTEMADHASFTVATDIPIYFAHPHSPWERGSNENTNGLVRQYLPKGTDLGVHSQADLDEVADRLNGRPRPVLDARTPAEALNALLISPTGAVRG
jgi:transposase, IS30 family